MRSEKLKITIIQFPRKLHDPALNIRLMGEYFQQVPEDSDAVLLPETWLGGEKIPIEQYEETVFSLLAKLKAPQCLLVAGAHYTGSTNHFFSRGFFCSKKDPRPVYYDKQFPSNAIGERKHIEKGVFLPLIEHNGIKMGAAVCVDLFYPEVVRSLAIRGSLIIFNPASIPEHRAIMWQQLGVARASENTVYVVMANNTASRYPDGRAVEGGSFIAFPDGATLLSCGKEPGVFNFIISLDLIDTVRQRWRYLEDIRENQEKIKQLYNITS
ncbi:MAG: carbon-nitrogen hydrolase family protein [Peptococcaceae bacterium]|nr:MAG: carbon-nitrogen hydrolase family protein [Peptococcaceae bacterium]